MRRELHLLARHRGVPDGGGTDCAVCIRSPFDECGRTGLVLGRNFTDQDLLHPHDQICAGCAELLSGRPGREPPPLRTRSVVAGDEWIAYPDRAGLWSALRDAREDARVVSWATSGQRHHWLRAGYCTPDTWLIGSDDGQIVYRPRQDRPLLDAVSALLSSPTGTAPILSRTAIRTGAYTAPAVERFGRSRWAELEAIVGPWRPSLLLDMLATITPLPEAHDGPGQEDDGTMYTPEQEQAARILALIAEASSYRREHGKEFWGGVYRHRIERVRCLPLDQIVARLMDALGAQPTAPGICDLIGQLRGLDDRAAAGIAKAIEEQPALLIAMAYDEMRRRRQE